MRKVGDITPGLLDGSSVYDLIKLVMLVMLLANRRVSDTKVKVEAERDVIYLIFSQQLYICFIISILGFRVHICVFPLSCR